MKIINFLIVAGLLAWFHNERIFGRASARKVLGNDTFPAPRIIQDAIVSHFALGD